MKSWGNKWKFSKTYEYSWKYFESLKIDVGKDSPFDWNQRNKIFKGKTWFVCLK